LKHIRAGRPNETTGEGKVYLINETVFLEFLGQPPEKDENNTA
jgi:hypothetical protein